MASVVLLPSFMTDEECRQYVRDSNAADRICTTESEVAGGLSAAALTGINEALRRVGSKPLGEEFGRLHRLVGFLQTCPDEPALFPKGKWATIQHVEYLIGVGRQE